MGGSGNHPGTSLPPPEDLLVVPEFSVFLFDVTNRVRRFPVPPLREFGVGLWESRRVSAVGQGTPHVQGTQDRDLHILPVASRSRTPSKTRWPGVRD